MIDVAREAAEEAKEDALFEQLLTRLKYLVLRASRALALAAVAVWLAASQPHADYHEIAIGILVLILGSLNRFNWLAGVVVLWMLSLYLVTPEMVAGLKAMRG